MERSCEGLNEGVTVFREGRLAPEVAHAFAAQQVAATTHLPTGGQDSRVETLNAPPGGGIPARPAVPDDSLLQVVTGRVRLHWGGRLEHASIAAAGDALLIPAGIAFQALNDSPVDALQLILVRGT